MNTFSIAPEINADAQVARLLLSSVTDFAIYMLDLDGNVSSWNRGAERVKGYRAEEILGKHFSIFYTQEERDAQTPQRTLSIALARGRYESEGTRVRRDGTLFWASAVIEPIRDDSGAIVGFAKVTRDITERKRTQEALHESEQRFRLLVQGVSDYAIYMLSPEGIIENWNVGAERIKGYAEQEVLGSHFSRFYTEEDRKLGKPAVGLAVAATEGRYESEGWRVRKDGVRFWAHVIIDAIFDEQRNLIGFAKITRDITEKKEAEKALAKANAALFQAQKLESIGKLTGGLAHDFNNLLSVLSNGLEILAVRHRTAAEDKLFTSMRRAIAHGTTMIKQLLAFARKQPLKAQRNDINTLIRNFDLILHNVLPGNVALDLKFGQDLSEVLIDQALLESSLLNLVVNACDAMPGGGAIEIKTESVDAQSLPDEMRGVGGGVRISVRDTGSGIPPELLERIFEPFFTTKAPGKGTGLGLSQVYGFIKQSGGDVEIQSQSGIGTTISMVLPGCAPVNEEARVAGLNQAVEPGSVVLVVDEAADVRNAGAEMFRCLGYEVITESDPHRAHDILVKRDDIEVLVSDQALSERFEGASLARTARQAKPHIKIILTSDKVLQSKEQGSASQTEFNVMPKPYQLSDVIDYLNN